jgi:Glyoxalase/Bleomycin resistance protein/Dioxygenase superfamily
VAVQERSGVDRKPKWESHPVSEKARFIGINHVAIEVGDIDDALDFYGHIFDFELRGRIG